jgi:hypothetical protein
VKTFLPRRHCVGANPSAKLECTGSQKSRETKSHNILRNNCAEKCYFLPIVKVGNRLI